VDRRDPGRRQPAGAQCCRHDERTSQAAPATADQELLAQLSVRDSYSLSLNPRPRMGGPRSRSRAGSSRPSQPAPTLTRKKGQRPSWANWGTFPKFISPSVTENRASNPAQEMD
jgi:hypothetical protein